MTAPRDKKARTVRSPRTLGPPRRTVQVAQPSHLPFVLDLQRKWSDSVGFLPRSALLSYLEDSQTLIVYENGAPAGYLNWTCTARGLVCLQQVAIDPSLLRTTLGSKIMQHIARAGVRGSCSVVRLRSRSDLTANQFWPTLGFSITATFLNPSKRMLPLIEWTRPLIDPFVVAAGFLNGPPSFRPILRKRPPPDLRSALLSPLDPDS